MFGSSLPPVVCGRAHVLFTAFLEFKNNPEEKQQRLRFQGKTNMTKKKSDIKEIT
jgi:hypothetical protein